MLRVAFDARSIRQGAGIGRYSACLLQTLLEERQEQFVLLGAKKQSFPDICCYRSIPVTHLPVSDRIADIAWHRLRMPIPAEWFTGEAAVFHSPNYLLPPLRRAKGVITVHDLSFLKMPQYADPNLVKYLQATLPHSLAKAEVILTDSANTADDLQELMAVPEAKLVVAYPGVGREYNSDIVENEYADLQRSYGLTQPYLLCVGTIEPRKNYREIIAAFKIAKECTGFTGCLAIACGTGWLAADSFTAVKEAGADALLLGRVAEKDLPALYRQAFALVYASHYEGFGLPPLEAMACGTPVVVANNSSLPEVVGDAGIYCNTGRESIASAMAQMINDECLRKKMVDAGLNQAKRFTWKNTAAVVRRVYHEVA